MFFDDDSVRYVDADDDNDSNVVYVDADEESDDPQKGPLVLTR